MAIRCSLISVIIPIKHVDRVYPGGWGEFGKGWEYMKPHHDAHLLRLGAMSPGDTGHIVESWTDLGLIATEDVDGKRVFKDLCVVEAMLGGPTLPCDWLAFDNASWSVWLAGTDPGEIVEQPLPELPPWPPGWVD